MRATLDDARIAGGLNMCQPANHRVAVTRAPAAALACAVAGLLASAGALAEGAPNVLNDPFQITLGTFALNNDTEVRLDGDTSQGTPIDWERTIGDDDATRFRVDGYWRFADRHKLRFLWFNFSRDGSREADREIDWGGETIPVGTRVEGETGFDVYAVSYEYAFLRRETWELAANIGVHYADLSWRLAAQVDVPNDDNDRSVDREASLGAPLPVIGLHGTWQLPYQISIDASALFFSLSIDEYDGSLQNYRIGVTWQPRKWLGVGVGYDQFSVDADVDKGSFKGSLDWTYKGPMIYYSVVF